MKSLSSGSRAGMSTGVNSHVAVVLTIGHWGDDHWSIIWVYACLGHSVHTQ